MPTRWTERVPQIPGDLTSVREIAAEDVSTLFSLFSDPAVTAYMAPPPPTLAKFAGFVAWSHQQRERGHGLCFGIVPDGMTTAVGIIQVRSLDSRSAGAEWGFLLSAHFWCTGVFVDAATLVIEFAFTSMDIGRLEAHIAQRNRRAQAAVQKLGAEAESTIATSTPKGVPRDPEVVWALREDTWRNRAHVPRVSAHDVRARVRAAAEAAQRELQKKQIPETVEPYPLFMFDRRRREAADPGALE